MMQLQMAFRSRNIAWLNNTGIQFPKGTWFSGMEIFSSQGLKNPQKLAQDQKKLIFPRTGISFRVVYLLISTSISTFYSMLLLFSRVFQELNSELSLAQRSSTPPPPPPPRRCKGCLGGLHTSAVGAIRYGTAKKVRNSNF